MTHLTFAADMDKIKCFSQHITKVLAGIVMDTLMNNKKIRVMLHHVDHCNNFLQPDRCCIKPPLQSKHWSI